MKKYNHLRIICASNTQSKKWWHQLRRLEWNLGNKNSWRTLSACFPKTPSHSWSFEMHRADSFYVKRARETWIHLLLWIADGVGHTRHSMKDSRVLWNVGVTIYPYNDVLTIFFNQRIDMWSEALIERLSCIWRINQRVGRQMMGQHHNWMRWLG